MDVDAELFGESEGLRPVSVTSMSLNCPSSLAKIERRSRGGVAMPACPREPGSILVGEGEPAPAGVTTRRPSASRPLARRTGNEISLEGDGPPAPDGNRVTGCSTLVSSIGSRQTIFGSG